MKVANRINTGIALAFSILVPAALMTALGDDHPAKPKSQFNYPRGGPERTGFYPDVTLTDNPETIWSDIIGPDPGQSFGQPVIAGDRVILGDYDGHHLALNSKDGTQLWAVTVPGCIIRQAPVVIGEVIYFVSYSGVSARALADGSEIWSYSPPFGMPESSPLVINDLVIVGGGSGFLYALDSRTGVPRWQTDIVTDAPPDPDGFQGVLGRGKSKARPNTASSDGKLVFVTIFDQSRVVAIDLKTGEPRWSYQTKGWVWGMAAVGEGKVFFGSQDRKVYALDAETGKPAWTFETRLRADGDLAYAEGSVYIADVDGCCYRLDAKTGAKVWEYQTAAGPGQERYPLSGAPLVDSAAVYFGSADGFLYSLNREDGTLRWKHQPEIHKQNIGPPITDGRRIYVPVYPNKDKDSHDEPGIYGIVAIGAGRR